MTMKLNEYPNALSEAAPSATANTELKILGLSKEIEIQTERLGFMDAEIEKVIAQDKDLKNEQQRKTRRLELQQQPDYLQTKSALKEAKQTRDSWNISLNLLRNQFSVAKLEMRMAIAKLESAA